jgi:hypothetical protein
MTTRKKGARPRLLLAVVLAVCVAALALRGVARYLRGGPRKRGPAPARKADKRGK